MFYSASSAFTGSYLPLAGGAMSGPIDFSKGADIASNTLTDIGAATGNYVTITGTTTITAFGTAQAGTMRWLRFSGALTVTHNASSLIIPGGANLLTRAGDVGVFVSEGSGNWRCIGYMRGSAVTPTQLQPITASVAANALTIGLNPTALDFRTPAGSSGLPLSRSVDTPITLTVPSGATLGTTSGQQSRLIFLALDNAGTVELGIVREGGGLLLDETNLVSTVAISASSNTAGTVYSQTARTTVAYRVVGFVDITEATAGVWATAPSLVQGVGGQAMASQSSFGFGQAWVDVTGSRLSGTTYYNTTGKLILAYVTPASAASPSAAFVNGFTLFTGVNTVTPYIIPVPPNGSYSSTPGGGVSRWVELR